jgi:hypothetical protein
MDADVVGVETAGSFLGSRTVKKNTTETRRPGKPQIINTQFHFY